MKIETNGQHGREKVEQVEFDTFDIPRHLLKQLEQIHPSACGGEVRVRKYHVSIKLVEEPLEVIHGRILDLCHACDNHHHWGPLRDAARHHGLARDHVELAFGRDRREKQEGEPDFLYASTRKSVAEKMQVKAAEHPPVAQAHTQHHDDD